MRKYKKMIAYTLSAALLITGILSSNVSAVEYHFYEGGPLTEEEEFWDQWNHFSQNPPIVPANGESIIPYGVDPGDGAINIYRSQLISDGTIYEDVNKSFDVLSLAANIAVNFFKDQVQTVFSVITTTLDAAGIVGSVEMSSPATLRMGHSMSYQCDVGEFYYRNQWRPGADIQNILYFKHSSTTCVINGQTRQVTVDFTYNNGYQPYAERNPEFYGNTSAIRAIVQEQYNAYANGAGIYEPYIDIAVPHSH